MKSTKLILLTAEFPYGKGDTFLESEIPYLSKSFDEIIIVSNDTRNDLTHKLPENCRARRFDLELSGWEKLCSLAGLFTKEFKDEKKYVRNHLKLQLSTGIRNTMLVSLFRGKKVMKNLIDVNGSSDFSNTICYTYWCDDNAMGLALLKKQFPELTTVSRVHGWDLYFEATEFNYLPYRKYIVNGLDKVYPISRKGHDYIVNRWGIQGESINVRRLGSIDGELIKAGTPIKIVSCSNLIPLKRVELIALALSKIGEVELEWFHFGDGLGMEKLESIAAEVPENIRVNLAGRKSNSEILTWYRENGPSLFLNVSTTEGIPVSIMEAMSFGTPVLATDVGGTSEIVNDENGELLPVNLTAALLSERIEAFLELSAEEQAQKRHAAFETWRLNYDAKRNYAEFAMELAKIL